MGNFKIIRDGHIKYIHLFFFYFEKKYLKGHEVLQVLPKKYFEMNSGNYRKVALRGRRYTLYLFTEK